MIGRFPQGVIMHRLAGLAAAVVMLGAGTSGAQTPSVVPIASLTSDDYSDLEPLRSRLEGVRVVALGESTHGTAEFSQVKFRLIRFLHEAMGFDVVAFESDAWLCGRAAAAADKQPARTTLTGCVYGVWHTHEVLALFDYMRASWSTDRPLRLAGIDVQPIGPNKDVRPAWLAGVVATLDSDYAARVQALDEAYLAAYALGGSARRQALRSDRDRLIAGYADLADFLDRNRARLIERHAGTADPLAPLLARQSAWSSLQYLRSQTAASAVEGVEARDWGMARNLIDLAAQDPQSKIIVWAHNAHIAHNNERIDLTGFDEPQIASRGAGSWMKPHFGAGLFTVGVYGQSGVSLRNNREPMPFSEVRPGSLEARSIPGDAPAALFIAPADWTHDPLWGRPSTGKYWGVGDLPMVPGEQYDAVLMLRHVSPPQYLD